MAGAKSGLRCGEVLLLRRGKRAGDGGVSDVPRRDQSVRDLCGLVFGAHGGIDVTLILPVSNMDEAIRFDESAGFDIERHDDGCGTQSLAARMAAG